MPNPAFVAGVQHRSRRPLQPSVRAQVHPKPDVLMTVSRMSLMSAMVLAVASCSDPYGPSMQEASQFSMAGPSHHVVGSGHVEQATGLREFTFHAVDRPDGTVAGSFKIILPSGLFFEADVTCLAVDGNTGWVGGVIRETNAAVVIVGSVSTFYAVDNGEGVDAADVVSVAAFNGAAGADVAFCADRPLLLPPLTVDKGNVQVR